MAAVLLSTKQVGETVTLKEGGTPVKFIVVHQGKPSALYDESCNGTWLLREDLHSNLVWDGTSSSYNNKYEESDIDAWLNGTYLQSLDANIQAAIIQAKIPYRKGGGSGGTDQTGASGLPRKIFLLSGQEVGFTTAQSSYFPKDGDRLAYFLDGDGNDARNKRLAHLSGASATYWWLRSPYTGSTDLAWIVSCAGSYYSSDTYNAYGIRPALILPSSLLVSDDGSVSTNTAPTAPGSITIPPTIQGGQEITISWTASTDKENNLDGYKVERSVNRGGAWAQIYQGNALSTTNTVPVGTQSVMYRVKAYDRDGLESGYTTSIEVTVINNNAPTAPPSITVPMEVNGGSSLTITWGQASDTDGNLSGYELERATDGGGQFTRVYDGSAQTYTDNIEKGWVSVQYRVRAYDVYKAYSPYTTSEVRTVNNNTPPKITCAEENGKDLGEKTEGFTVSYETSDDDGDSVTVKEAIDGVQKRSFTSEGSCSFEVTGDYFQKLLNGKRTMTIEASDGKSKTVHTLTFTKKVNELSVTLKEPMEADAEITICVLSVIGSIPADAEYKVEVCNNAKDDVPAWEDCTAAVKTGANHIFSNQTAEKGNYFNFRITAKRGESGQGGYIISVQGGFQ